MEVQNVETIVCPQCLQALPAAVDHCTACGHATHVRAPQPKPPLEDRGWFVLAIVFGAALFLGYPLLWRTRAFDRRTKVVLSLLVIVETIVVFGLFGVVMRWVYLRISESLA